MFFRDIKSDYFKLAVKDIRGQHEFLIRRPGPPPLLTICYINFEHEFS